MAEESKAIKRTILEYLERNPDAGGNLFDITEYWIKFQKAEEAVDEVKEVLHDLVATGEIKALSAKDGTTVYKSKKEKKTD